MRINRLLSFCLLFISSLIVFPNFAVADPLDTWHLRYTSSYSTSVYAITYANGIFVAVGNQGTILYSVDGIAWEPRTSGTSMNLNGVTYGNGTFVAVGDHGTILISPDGQIWTPRTPYSGTTTDLYAIAWGNGIFVAVGYYKTVLTSPDGYTWTARTLQAFGECPYLVRFGNGIFVLLGKVSLDIDPSYIFTSPDGLTWTERESPASYSLLGVAYGNSSFVAVGSFGTVLTSPDGSTWTERNSGTSESFYSVAHGNNTFVAVGDYGVIFTSPDGVVWTQRNSGTSTSLYGVTYGNGTFVAVGEVILQSDPMSASYFDTVQEVYIGYYQRPADPGGLIYWAERLYRSGGNLSEIIEAFANSAESQALYGTINSSNISTVVNGIYNALFGRDAEAGGLSYYINGFNSGRFTAATIMLNVLYGAQNEDLQSINNKRTAANLFTRTIDPELDGSNFQVTYAGDGDAIAGRNFLTFVTWDPLTVPTQDGTTVYIQTNIANPGDPILGQTPPSAPSNLSTTSGNTQAIISWSPVAGATSYNIYWSTTSGVTKIIGTKITGATSPYSHTGLTNGTPYYYVVTAVNSSGESMESAQVSVTPAGIACDYSISPTSQSFDSTGGTGSVNVTAPSGCSWTATSNNTDWITITSGSSGSGNGIVTYTVAANTSTSQRTGKMAIAGQTFTVTQASHSPSPTDLLKDAAWSLNPSRGQLTTISWINRRGVTVQGFAYSGEVRIIVDPTKMTHADVQSLVSQHQAAIFARLPAVGLYWVNVSAGSEASFIAALRGAVTDVFPVLAMASKQSNSHLQLPLNYDNSMATAPPYSVSSGNLVLDDFTEPMCLDNCPSEFNPNPTGPQVYVLKNFDGSVPVDSNGNFNETTNVNQAAAHGDIVNFYRTNRNQLLDNTLGQSTVDVNNPPLPPPLLPGTVDDMLNIASMVKGSTDIGQKAVINYSRGPDEYGNELERITGWESYNQNNYDENYEEFSALLGADVPGTHNTIIVQAAGNSGTDLTSVVVEQQTLHPTAAKQIVEVGALDAEGNIASYSNYSTAAGTMIYVPVTGKTNPSGYSLDGTSFAAPQIQYLVGQIMKNRPDLTPDQLRQVLFDESVAPVQITQRPNAPIGENISVSVIRNPYDSSVLDAAIAAANYLFPPTTSCTYTYSDWSACQPNNTQTRTVISSSPAGCVGTPVLTQSCTYVPPTCTYSINPTSQTFDSTGGNGSINVTTQSGCNWTATSNNPDWITITSGSSGTGNGTVTYTVTANTDTSQRTGTMIIAGQTFTVTQAVPPEVIETTSQMITAAQGGTITLPGGSSVTIPAGALASDQTVHLSLVSSLPKQPPSGVVVGVGPALSLSFSTNQPFLGTTQTKDLLFILKYGSTTPAGLVGSAPVADIVDDDNFAGLVSLSCDPNSTCTVLPISAVQSFPTTSGIHVSAANLIPLIERTPLPTPGAKSWNGTNWVDGVGPLDSNNKCVLLVHGMMSCVEKAFGDRNTVELIKRAGGYNCVLGFDYDWTKGIDDSGAQLATFLSSLHTAGVNPIDIEAHSEGGPVLLSGACQNQDMPIANIVMLGSPVTGTPAAYVGTSVQLAGGLTESTISAIATTVINLQSGCGVPVTTLYDAIHGQYATDLQPGSAVLLGNNGCVASKMAEPLSNLATTYLTCVGGTDYTASGDASFWGGTILKYIFGSTQFDGIVGTAVAKCEGAGFDPARVNAKEFPLSHTRLETDVTVINWVGSVVSAHPYVPIPIFRGTAVTTVTASTPNIATWYHCLPDPLVITGTTTPITVELVLDANPLLLGPISGTVYLGSSSITATTPESTCTRLDEGYPREWVVPATTTTETVPSSSETISGHSDGTNIVIDASIDLPSYCSETFTGTVTTAPVTGIVQFSGQDIVTCILDGGTEVHTTTYSLTRQ